MIRVIIEREIAEGLEQYYESAIAQVLDVMSTAPGYLSAESLVEIQRPNHYVVISRWSNEEAWNRWIHSAERQEVLNVVRPFLMNQEKFTMLRQLIFHQGEESV